MELDEDKNKRGVRAVVNSLRSMEGRWDVFVVGGFPQHSDPSGALLNLRGQGRLLSGFTS